MKKFDVIYFSDVRWNSEINEVFNIEVENGRKVFELIIEMEGYNNDWVKYVSDMINDKENSWVSDKSKWDKIFCLGCEGDVESSEFNFSLCDEFRSVMVIREDSEYFGKFKKSVSCDNEYNIGLYYDILESLWK